MIPSDRVALPDRSARPARRVRPSALVLPAATVAGLVTILLIEARVDPARLPADSGTWAGWVSGVNAVVLGALAAIALSRSDHRRFGLTLGWFGVFWALDGIAEAYYRLGLLTADPLPGMTFATWFLMRFTALLPVTVAALLLLFPDGRFLAGRWGVIGKAALALFVLTCLTYLVVPSRAFDPDAAVPAGVDPDPTTLPLPAPVAEALPPILLLGQLVAIVPALASAVVRYRRTAGVDRDRMRWLLWGVIATVLAVVASLVVDLGPLELVWVVLAFNLPPAAMTVAVVDPRLVPIGELLSRTLVYGGLAAIILVVDLAAVAGLTALLGDALSQPEVVATVLLISVLLYGPLRGWLWRGARRIVLGERDRPYDVVAGLASTLETAAEGSEQLAAVAAAVARAFRIGFVRIEVDRGGGERLVTVHGTAPPRTRTLPILYRDAEVGRLVLPAQGLRSRLSGRDEQLLGDLVRQAATVARTGRLADELQDSRERLVVAREEERRRIRRDLHDGLGPALGGLVFRLESARLLVDRDPAAAREQLATTTAQVQEIVADVRRLVHELRPPALDDRGLVGALRQQAAALADAGPAVEVVADDLGPLPAAVEVAAYRIAAEALTNVLRHAGARSCRIRLTAADGSLLVEVTDDGAGMPADAPAGVGLLSLRERAAELGGHTEVSCPAGGGTVVRAWLPVRPDRVTALEVS